MKMRRKLEQETSDTKPLAGQSVNTYSLCPELLNGKSGLIPSFGTKFAFHLYTCSAEHTMNHPVNRLIV